MILLPRPYPDEVIGSVLARGARHLGLSWGRLLWLATGRSGSSAPYLMPFALARLAKATGTDPEYLLERHTLFPYATSFMPLDRRQALKARALRDGELCGVDALGHVVLSRTPYRRVCPHCVAEDLASRGETYWRRSHLLPGAHVCVTHGTPLASSTLPLQHGAGASDALLPSDAKPAHRAPLLDFPLLESIAMHSVRALRRRPVDRNWLERYWVAAFALGYRLRRGAVASAILAADVKRLFGKKFLDSIGAPIDLRKRSPWPTLLVRPQYPTRVAAFKHVLMLTFLEHATEIERLETELYRRPGPKCRDYKRVDAEALARMRRYVREHGRGGRRLTVRSLVEASGEAPCMKRFPDRFPRSKSFLREFRKSSIAARRVREPGTNGID